MSDARKLLQDQIDAITTQVHWFAGLERALEGSTAAEAAWRPAEGLNTIWQLVNHMTFWTQYMINLLTNQTNPEGHIENAITFGAPGDEDDEAGWSAAKEGLFAVQAKLKSIAAETDLAQAVGKSATIGKVIIDVTTHNAMHLGQIILLRKLRAQEWQPVNWNQ